MRLYRNNLQREAELCSAGMSRWNTIPPLLKIDYLVYSNVG